MSESTVIAKPVVPAPAVLKRSHAVPLSYAAIIVCFFFTFINVSCQGEMVARLTGVQLATGTELGSSDVRSDETRKVNPELRAGLALLAAFVGLVVGLGGAPLKRITTIAGVAGFVLMLLLKAQIENDVARKGQGLFELKFEPPFFAATALFVLAAVLSHRLPKSPG